MTKEHLKSIQQDLDPTQRLYQIVEHGMCIGCGLCQSVCGEKKIKIENVENGCPRPVVTGELSHQDMDRVMDVCPGTRVDGLPSWQIDDASLDDSIWGVWREIYLAWSGDPEIRHMASTGGVLTEIALYLLESGEVDFILQAREPKDNPTFGESVISRSREEILTAAGSRYGPTPALISAVETIDLAEKNNQTFAFIGTPHDVSALRNYARHDARVDQYCKAMLVMVCGGFMGADSMRDFLTKLDVEFDDVTSMRYRGYGNPGPTTFTTKDGRKFDKNYLDFWGDDESYWGLPPRCKICPDGIGDSADIAASDTWDGGSPTWEGQIDDLGHNAIIVRTQRGLDLMNNAIAAGYIVRGDSLDPRDMDRFQPHQRNKKQAVWARYQGMKAAGHVVPETHGLRLEELYKTNDPQENRKQTDGARQRVEKGGFAENTPVKKVV